MSESITVPETPEVLAPVVNAIPTTGNLTAEQLLDPAFDTVDKTGLEVDAALLEIVQSLIKKEEDPEQETLVTSLQKHRALLLKFATLAYLKKPSSAMMLSSLSALMGDIEKAVRADRKEQAKKDENQSNQYSFTQIVESLNAIAAGAVITPTFELTSFILDPTKSLMDVAEGFKPIKATELTTGNALVDIDGNPI